VDRKQVALHSVVGRKFPRIKVEASATRNIKIQLKPRQISKVGAWQQREPHEKSKFCPSKHTVFTGVRP